MNMRVLIIFSGIMMAMGTIMFSPVLGEENKEMQHLEVKMIDVLYYRDGGTTGFVTEVDGRRELFCLDGRAVSGSIFKPQWHIFTDVTHPTHAGAKKVPIGRDEEIRIITILSTWINSELSITEQKELIQGKAPRTDLHKTKLWWAMKVKKQLVSRQTPLNNVVQPTRPNGGHVTDH